MRVLFMTFAVPSHVYNMAPLAWALRSAGHEVRVAGHPDITPVIQMAGLTSVAVGDPLDLAARHQDVPFEDTVYGSGYPMAESRPEVLTWDYVRNVFRVHVSAPLAFDAISDDRVIADLMAFTKAWQPDLMIWDSMCYSVPAVAGVLGIPHVRLLSGPDILGRMRGVFLDLARRQSSPDDPMAEWLARKVAPYGGQFSEDMVTGQATIDPLPSWMRPAVDVKYIGMRQVPFHGSTSVPSWLLEPPTRPRVCLTLGLTGRMPVGSSTSVSDMSEPAVTIPELLAAMAELDVEVVATLNAEQLADAPDLPDNVRIFDFVPLNELLPACSAIIHHGGTGTLSTALLHGVPQLIVPGTLWDEGPKAEAVVQRGVGLSITPEDLSPGLVRRQLERLLAEPSFAENAALAREEVLKTPTPHELVPELLALA
jgi:glycosyltransferase (activator-dependent family)